MSPYQRKQRKKERKRIFRKWHRRIGFAASLFLFNLAITGLILNHYQALSLQQKYVQNNWLLNWYGVQPPQDIDCVNLSESSVCQVGDQLFLTRGGNETRLLMSDSSQLVNLVKTQSEVYLVTANQINVYDDRYRLIESIDVTTDSSSIITAAILSEDQLFIRTEQQWLSLDSSIMEFQELAENELPAAVPLTQPLSRPDNPALTQSLTRHYREHQITWLKLIQDLHSGQILSLQGKLLTDLTGVIIMLLAVSGFITWQRRKNTPPD